MRSPFVLAACLAALRIELEDVFYIDRSSGVCSAELDKLKDAQQSLLSAETSLRNFRFRKKSEDLPGSSPASKPISS